LHAWLPAPSSWISLPERGGNCELTQAGKTVKEHGVTIIGQFNIATNVPYHASQMYAKNLSAFLLNLVKEWQAANKRERRNSSRDLADTRW